LAERRNPDLIDQSRRERIAAGSGMQVTDVSALLSQFREMQKMMKRMGGIGSKKMNKGRHAKKSTKRGKGGGRTPPEGVTGGRTPTWDPEKELRGLPPLRGGGSGAPGARGPAPG